MEAVEIIKILKREDIEELGWTYKNTNGMRNWYTSDKWFNNVIPGDLSGRYWDFELVHDPTYNHIKINIKTNDGEWDTFYQGWIINKARLETLMRQLNLKLTE